jgi:hypothetical protein
VNFTFSPVGSSAAGHGLRQKVLPKGAFRLQASNQIFKQQHNCIVDKEKYLTSFNNFYRLFTSRPLTLFALEAMASMESPGK